MIKVNQQLYLGHQARFIEAAAAAFKMGADFILSGSINQCTVEAGTSDDVKALLQDSIVQNTEYAPAGDNFETGARVQVLRRACSSRPGPTSCSRGIPTQHPRRDSREDVQADRDQVSQEDLRPGLGESRTYYESKGLRHEVVKAEANPKHKMALVFRWYSGYSSRLALSGEQEERVNYQVHTGPALGACALWVKGSEMEPWARRHAGEICLRMLAETAEYLNRNIARWIGAA